MMDHEKHDERRRIRAADAAKNIRELMEEVEGIDEEFSVEGLRGLIEDLASHVRRLVLERDAYATRAHLAEDHLRSLRDEIRKTAEACARIGLTEAPRPG